MERRDAPISPRTPAASLHAAAPMRLVGRNRELSLLRTHLREALAGYGGVAIVGGAAGIGKTALVEDLGREATAAGALVLTGQCYDLTETPPYGPWLELASRYPAPANSDSGPSLPPLPPVLAGRGSLEESSSQDALYATIRDFLTAVAVRQPLLLALEDLHWADAASLDLLRRLGREAGRFPLLVLVTYRDDELAHQDPLAIVLPLLVRESRATRIDLHPLGDDDLRALIETRYARLPVSDLDRLVESLQARAEGSPFFLGELLRALEDEQVLRRVALRATLVEDECWELGDISGIGLPLLLRQVLDRRLARLAKDERGYLAVASVIGQAVPLALWAAVELVEEEALFDVVEQGVEARVLEASDDGLTVRFSHALIREALYEGLLPPRRRIWHRRVAEALLSSPSPDPDAVAYHFRQAQDSRAGEWLVRAAERAQRAYAWLTAAERYEAALTLLEASDTTAEERATLLLTLAQLRRYTAAGRGVADLEEAERLAHAAGDQTLAASAVFDRGHLRCIARDFELGIDEMKAGLAILEALSAAELARLPSFAILGVPPNEHRHYHRGVLVLFLAVIGRLAEARHICAPVTAHFQVTARELLGRGWLHAMLGQPDLARQSLVASRIAYGEQHWEVGTTFFFELDLVVVPYETDHLTTRHHLADEAERVWTRSSGALADIEPEIARLPLMLLEGQWTRARELATAMLTATRSNEAWRRYPARYLGLIAYAQGDVDLVWQLVRDEFPAGPATAPGATWYLPALALQRLAAALALDAGDLATARAWLRAHDRWLTWSGAILGQAEGRLGWAAYHQAAGDLVLARAEATRALECASAPRQPLSMIAAHRLLGDLATTAGQHAEAVRHLDQALALTDACATPHERALTLLSLAALQRAMGHHAALDALLTEVRSICEPLGARRTLALADALAPRRVAAPPGGYPAGLTGREVEVLTLIAMGHSNQQIADMLFLSVRTVERHINNLYRKIDAAGRTDATVYAARHGLVSA